MNSTDAVVVGGGILGAAVAYHLARDGVRTVLADHGHPGHATRAGAGIVCPVTATVGDGRLVDLAFAAAEHYPTLVTWLADDLPAGGRGAGTGDAVAALGGDRTGFAMTGMLSLSVAGHGTERVKATAAWAAHIAGRTRYAAMAGHTAVAADGARQHCPVLSPDVDAALLVPWAARVDGDRFRHVLLAAARQRGAAVRAGTVQRIEQHRDGVSVVIDGEPLAAGWAVVCAGAWTGQALPGLDAVSASRGEILHIVEDGLDTGGWPLVEVEGTGPYLIPWAGGRLAVGATVEPAAVIDARPSVAGIRWGLDALRRATGDHLARAKVAECRVGFRPVTADGLPLIGPAPGAARILLATGHGANGLSWGPYTGRLIAELVTGRPPGIDLAPFSPARFTGAPAGPGTAVHSGSNDARPGDAGSGQPGPGYAHSRTGRMPA
jgi:D-amino-acid dehydrogenase